MMREFVKHFTTLDVKAWDRALFRTDGPGCIEDIAHFCSSAPHIENRPNIGNTLVAAAKELEQKPLSEKECREAWRGLFSEDTCKNIDNGHTIRYYSFEE